MYFCINILYVPSCHVCLPFCCVCCSLHLLLSALAHVPVSLYIILPFLHPTLFPCLCLICDEQHCLVDLPSHWDMPVSLHFCRQEGRRDGKAGGGELLPLCVVTSAQRSSFLFPTLLSAYPAMPALLLSPCHLYADLPARLAATSFSSLTPVLTVFSPFCTYVYLPFLQPTPNCCLLNHFYFALTAGTSIPLCMYYLFCTRMSKQTDSSDGWNRTVTTAAFVGWHATYTSPTALFRWLGLLPPYILTLDPCHDRPYSLTCYDRSSSRQEETGPCPVQPFMDT